MTARKLTKKQKAKQQQAKAQEESLKRRLLKQINSTSRKQSTSSATLASQCLVTAPTLSVMEQSEISEGKQSRRTSLGVSTKTVRSATKSSVPDLTYRDSSHSQYPSAKLTPQKEFVPVVLSAEMQERERIAQQEIARKKKRVAPLFNKGGLQYISDDTDLTTLGKKV